MKRVFVILKLRQLSVDSSFRSKFLRRPTTPSKKEVLAVAGEHFDDDETSPLIDLSQSSNENNRGSTSTEVL